MQKIKYEFCDGTIQEVEVSDKFYNLHLQLLQEEKQNHWRETRRHISLNYLNELGVDFTSCNADPLTTIIEQEHEEKLHKAIHKLSDKQRRLIEEVFFEEKTLSEIAKEENVTQPAITQRLATVIKKLKKLL